MLFETFMNTIIFIKRFNADVSFEIVTVFNQAQYNCNNKKNGPEELLAIT